MPDDGLKQPHSRSAFLERVFCAGLLCVGVWLADVTARQVVLHLAINSGERVGRQDGRGYVVNDLITRGWQPSGDDALILLDSTNDSIPAADPDRETVSAGFHRTLAPEGIEGYGVSFDGNGLDWVVTLLRFCLRRYPGFEYAVIPINLRWLSPLWRGRDLNDVRRRPYEYYASDVVVPSFLIDTGYSSPRRPADQGIAVLSTTAGPTAVDMMTSDAVSQIVRRDHTPVRQAIDAVLRARFALGYGVDLRAGDPLFGLLDRARATCDRHRVRCLFVLPPFNLAGMDRAQPAAARTLESNIAKVRRHMVQQGSFLLDLSRQLPPELFHDVANEHVSFGGRQILAACAAEAILTLHANAAPVAQPLSCGIEANPVMVERARVERERQIRTAEQQLAAR